MAAPPSLLTRLDVDDTTHGRPHRSQPWLETAEIALYAALTGVAWAVTPDVRRPGTAALTVRPRAASTRTADLTAQEAFFVAGAIDGWPVTRDSMYELAAACTVTAVEELGDEIVTTLECDDAGELRPATLHVAVTPDGVPSWGPGAAVVLAYYHLYDNELETGTYRSLSLRQAADEALLVAAIDGDTLTQSKWLASAPAEHLAPLLVTVDESYCGWNSQIDLVEPMPMQITLSLDEQSLALVDGQRGTLPVPGGTDRLAADLAEATIGHCCHYSEYFRLLVRRVS